MDEEEVKAIGFRENVWDLRKNGDDDCGNLQARYESGLTGWKFYSAYSERKFGPLRSRTGRPKIHALNR